MTDKGQASASLEALNNLAPVTPSLAEATVLAPECNPSALPSPTSRDGVLAPAVSVTAEDSLERPQSPETLIPATDTLSTRPTRGGVAYPFRLKVDGAEGDVNASTLTLQSVQVASPGLENHKEEDKGLHNGVADDITKEEGVGRPPTASSTPAGMASLTSDGGEGVEGDNAKAERPGVERFETAQEDLSTLANGKA